MTEPNTPLPPLHDGFLNGFLVAGREVRIFVRTEGGVPFTLILSDVKRLNVDAFSEGNIILDCEVSTSPDIPVDTLAALNHGVRSAKEFGRLRELVVDEGYKLLTISPSYGAQVVALIKGLSVKE